MASSDERHECGTDVAAYALGALDAHEVGGFERHLERCAVCRDELAAFRGVVDQLPMSAPVIAAPPDLKRRVMAMVDDDVRAGADAGSERRDRRAAGRRRISWPWPAIASPRLGLALAATVAVIVVAGAVTLGGSGGPRVRVITAQMVGGSGHATLRVTGDRGELIVDHMPAPPAGHIYEVWLARAGHAPSPTTALFSVTSRGSGDVAVPGSLKGVHEVMVTAEPAGGSRVPTHAPVLEALLT